MRATGQKSLVSCGILFITTLSASIKVLGGSVLRQLGERGGLSSLMGIRNEGSDSSISQYIINSPSCLPLTLIYKITIAQRPYDSNRQVST